MNTKKRDMVRETAKKAASLYGTNNLRKEDLVIILKSAMAWEIEESIKDHDNQFNKKLEDMIKL